MTLLESIKTCFRKYIDFSGRASRSEFWWFQLFFLLALLVTLLFVELLDYTMLGKGGDNTYIWDAALLLEILLFFPVLAVTSRRLHDVGLSGWFQAPTVLIYLEDLGRLIPSLGESVIVNYAAGFAMFFFVLILLICIKGGTVGQNKYGPDPKLPDLDSVFN